MERRKFIRYVGTLSAVAATMPQLLSCDLTSRKIKTRTLGAPYERGHKLRGDMDFTNHFNTIELHKEVVIIGGGISGLSSAYHLHKKGLTDFLLLELADTVGGNSNGDKNEYSRFPLGAHYLSLANPENRKLIEFLKEHHLIYKEEDGKQWYNEEHLCHAPDERLLFKGIFHEGLVPEYGVSQQIHEEIQRFFEEMKRWRTKKDENGIDLFNIPISQSSNSSLLELDSISFDAWLDRNNYKSEELRWFLDYCCRDDYGAGSTRVSAWAGLHYFAGRKATPGNTEPTAVMTWAEGNQFLAKILEKPVTSNIRTGLVVTEILERNTGIEITAIDFSEQTKYKILSKTAVCSIPSYVAKHVVKSDYWPTTFFSGFNHNPWLIGIVVLNEIPESNGTPLAWDNVKFGTKGLGYVSNRNQEYKRHMDKHVISVYLALDTKDDHTERKQLLAYSEEEMKQLVMNELISMHPQIEEHVLSISFQRWGHGMITPYPGALKKYHEYQELNKSCNRLFLAHTDYSSYSVFEEAFDIGQQAANRILKKYV